MPFVKCPHCDQWHEIAPSDIRDAPPLEVAINLAELTPVAVAILRNRDHLPPAFLRGKPVPLRVLGDMVGYSYEAVRRGLQELVDLDLIQTIKFGRSGRVRYAGASQLARVKLVA